MAKHLGEIGFYLDGCHGKRLELLVLSYKKCCRFLSLCIRRILMLVSGFTVINLLFFHSIARSWARQERFKMRCKSLDM